MTDQAKIDYQIALLESTLAELKGLRATKSANQTPVLENQILDFIDKIIDTFDENVWIPLDNLHASFTILHEQVNYRKFCSILRTAFPYHITNRHYVYNNRDYRSIGLHSKSTTEFHKYMMHDITEPFDKSSYVKMGYQTK